MRKRGHTYTALKSKAILQYMRTGMREDAVLSERSHHRKTAQVHFQEASGRVRSLESHSGMTAVKSWGRGTWGGVCVTNPWDIISTEQDE